MPRLLVSTTLFATSVLVASTTATTTSPKPTVVDGECSIQEMEHLNNVLQTVSGSYPPECKSLSGLPSDLVTRTLCADRNCKSWVIETLKLRDCGNPALGVWQKIATERLAECPELNESSTTRRPGATSTPATESRENDTANNSTATASSSSASAVDDSSRDDESSSRQSSMTKVPPQSSVPTLPQSDSMSSRMYTMTAIGAALLSVIVVLL